MYLVQSVGNIVLFSISTTMWTTRFEKHAKVSNKSQSNNGGARMFHLVLGSVLLLFYRNRCTKARPKAKTEARRLVQMGGGLFSCARSGVGFELEKHPSS